MSLVPCLIERMCIDFLTLRTDFLKVQFSELCVRSLSSLQDTTPSRQRSPKAIAIVKIFTNQQASICPLPETFRSRRRFRKI